MIINKNTGNATVVDSLVIVGDDGKPIANVLEFNTETLSVSLDGGGSTSAAEYWFVPADGAAVDALLGVLGDEDRPRIELGKRRNYKKAMKNDGLPTNVLAKTVPIVFAACACSNCGTLFLVGSSKGAVYSLNKVNAADTLFTLTELDPTSVTCDSCSVQASVSV